jgi:predicted DNA-binding protein (MmcQ/YjbR family)
MTPKQIDTFCGKLPAATRTVQWEGVIVFKVGGKMFCLIAPEDHSVGRISFKSAPEHYDALSRSPGFRPAPYLARAKWVSVDDPKTLTDREMKAYLARAHAVIAAALPKKTQAALRLRLKPKQEFSGRGHSALPANAQPISKRRK